MWHVLLQLENVISVGRYNKVHCHVTPRLLIKNEFFLGKLALFVQQRGTKNGDYKKKLLSVQGWRAAYKYWDAQSKPGRQNTTARNLNKLKKEFTRLHSERSLPVYDFNSLQKVASLLSSQLLNSSKPLPSFSFVC